MSDDDIDFERVVSDPAYRRSVIDFLNLGERFAGRAGEERAGLVRAGRDGLSDPPAAAQSRP